jgi:hypothetical protein
MGYYQPNIIINRGEFGFFQYILHADALKYLGERINSIWPYHEIFTPNGIILCSYFNDNLNVVESFKKMNVEELTKFFEERKNIVRKYNDIVVSFD